MNSLSEFFAMGGYAAYVWPAYAVAAGIMIWLAWSSVRGLRADRRTLEDLQGKRREARAAGEAGEKNHDA